MIHVETVRNAMKEKQFTPSSLADRLGVNEQTVARWLAGIHHPMPHNFNRLCWALGLSWRELIYGKKKIVTTRFLCEE